MTEKQALAAATGLVEQWRKRDEDDFTADDTLKRLIADTFVALTDRAAHLGSIATMNELIWAARHAYDEEGPETLHIRAVEQGHIATNLLQALREVDQFYLMIVTSINDVLPSIEDVEVAEHLTAIRKAVMMSDEGVRDLVEQYEE